jgi:hypothetical protein
MGNHRPRLRDERTHPGSSLARRRPSLTSSRLIQAGRRAARHGHVQPSTAAPAWLDGVQPPDFPGCRVFEVPCRSPFPHSATQIFGQPPSKRRQPLAPHAIDAFSAPDRSFNQPGSLQSLQVLNNGCAGDRQTTCELTSGTGRARQALKNDHAGRMPEQRE